MNKTLKIGEKSSKCFTGEILKSNDETRTIIGVASHESPDRDGDVIKQEGWNLKNIKANPVMLWGHDYRGLPIAKIVKLWIEGKKLMFEAKFAGEEQNHPLAETIYKLFRDGFLKAFSVGFIPMELRPNAKTGGYYIDSAELLEISVVTVPAHPSAIVTQVKSMVKSLNISEPEADALVLFLKEAMVDEAPIEVATETKEVTEELKKSLDAEVVGVRDASEFEEGSLVTRELQKNPCIIGVFGKIKGSTTEELKASILRFPATDWDKDASKKWLDENDKTLKDLEYKEEKSTIKFLSNLLSEKHAELKSMRKFFTSFSEAVGVSRTANELETIEEVGLKMIGLLTASKLINSAPESNTTKPEVNLKAAPAARTADDVEGDLLAKITKG